METQIGTAVRVAAPGRINLIGEHTDYNEGFVLPAATGLHMQFSLQANGSPGQCRLFSETFQEGVSVDLGDLEPLNGSWANYAIGVLHGLSERTGGLKGFDARFSSTLPAGAGLSSSAALECGLAFGLNALFGLGLEPAELIALCQEAEHQFAGTRCGIMDQFAATMGKKGHFMLLDCRSLEHRYIPARLGAYRLLLVNSRVTHSLAGSAYNQRRRECEEGVRWLQGRFSGIRSLRDAGMEQVESVKGEMPEPLWNRCRYVVEENHRVLEAADALLASDMEKLGGLLLASHEGLRHQYEVSCPELDFLADTALSLPGVLGARMMGGGFGGCTLNLVHEDALKAVSSALTKAYRKGFGRDAAPFEVTPGDGVRLLP
jgi:galactokinase